MAPHMGKAKRSHAWDALPLSYLCLLDVPQSCPKVVFSHPTPHTPPPAQVKRQKYDMVVIHSVCVSSHQVHTCSRCALGT